MRRVMYDLTYAARGKSGIPKDTRSVAEILENLEDTTVEYVISPRNFVSRYSLPGKFKPMRSSKLVNSIFLPRPNLFSKSPNSYLFRSFVQSLNLQPYVQLEKIGLRTVSAVLKHIGLSEYQRNPDSSVSVMKVSYAARFVRPKLLGPFRINTKGIDFYIQQQIDPIKVGSSTHHIVRLHDILPITHPFFFPDQAQLAFRRGISSLLPNKRITWVMDTQASKNEFQEIFGFHLNVEVIPSEVGYGLHANGAIATIGNKNNEKNKNTYLCVNTIEPRKNVGLVINSFLSSLHGTSKKNNDELIIAGSYGWMEEELIFRLRAGFYGDQVIFIEKAQEFQIENLYKTADFVISASEAEGFGLPPLEGMLFGCLPIVSNLPQHRETMGPNAIYFDLNERSLTRAIVDSREISISERQKLALTLNSHVRNNFSHEVLKKDWEQLLARLKIEGY
jgi:glycosyltransferase involved in cell wall biosynthesis